MVDLPCDDAVALQFAQLLRKHLLGGIGQQASKFTETTAAIEKIKQDDRLPFSANHLKCSANGAVLSEHGFQKDSKAQNSGYLSKRQYKISF